ncbi:DUF2057 family protein [Erwinia tracheiphila]|uniref:DUF2057 family protein n=1 Tax=Erwinia tracheiphila TaxID=65700 RepID=UPI001FD76111|nr:DUF2057 family protein [Erwinia tracheiphila]
MNISKTGNYTILITVSLRLEKSVQTDSHGTVLWSSTPLIVTFNAQAKSVSISLPPLATLQQAISFNQQPEIHLYDECNKRLDNQQDRLFSNKEESFERAMMHYNIKCISRDLI